MSGNNLDSFNGSEVSEFAPNVWRLDLNGNNFKQLTNETFEGFVHLTLLDISNNNIAEIESYSFNNLTKLKQLYLNNNQLQTVYDCWFSSLANLELIDLKNNLIQSFLPAYFKWPTNLKILLLQDNSFQVLPPLPRNPELVNISDNRIDCSSQRHGQEEVEHDMLLNVSITCDIISTETWRKQHWENPFCRFPTVHIESKELKDGLYLMNCTGDGFPPPTVSLKHRGEIIAATSIRVKNKVIYSLTNDTKVTCEVNNTVGKNESHQIEIEAKTTSHCCL